MFVSPWMFWKITFAVLSTWLLLGVILYGRRWIWASPDVPLSRRLETACVLVIMLLIPVSLLLNLFCILCISHTWWFYIPYVTWSIFFNTSFHRGGKASNWFRNHSFWKKYANFFPIELVKESEDLQLNADTPYLFGYHPHGILSLGCIGNFASNSSNFDAVFPGINVSVVTLNFNVRLPFLREILLPLGFISADRKAVEYVLNKGPGNAVVLVVGGANEAMKTAKGRHDLILRRRKGFFKIALRTGASLVPVYSFGENLLFDVQSSEDNTFSVRVSQFFQRIFGFTVPVARGRGIFQYSFGLLPFRHAIHTVVGKPVKCPRIENPTAEDIATVQDEYCARLTELFNKFKDIYCKNPQAEILRFVE